MQKTSIGWGGGILLGLVFFFLLKNNVQDSIEASEKRLQIRMEEMERRMQSGKIATSSTTESIAPKELLEQLSASAQRIENLSLSPHEKMKESANADEVTKKIEKFGKEASGAIEASFQKPGNLEFRRRLMRLLGKTDREKGFQMAERCFLREGDDVNVRWAAAAVMKEIDSQRATPILAQFLIQNDGTRHSGMSYVVDTLKEIGNEEAKQALLQIALDVKKDPPVRYRAVDSLGTLKMSEAVPYLRQMVELPGNAYLRINASRSLYLIQEKEACDFLKQIADKEEDDTFQPFLIQLISDKCR